MSEGQKTATATTMIENAIRLAVGAGREFSEGRIEAAMDSCGACLGQLYAFEAMRQGQSGTAVVQEWNDLWIWAVQGQKQQLRRAAIEPSRN